MKMEFRKNTTATLLTILFLASISMAPVLPVVADPIDLVYDDGTFDGVYPEVHIDQYLRQRFLVSDFGISGDCLVETVRICWGPISLDFAGVIMLRDYDTGDLVPDAIFSSSDIIPGWQDYDVSGLGFVSDHFYVELWQTSGHGYICSDTDGTLHYMSEVSTDRGATWHIADMNFMIRASVTPVSIIDIDPDTLNLKGSGQWITAYIELPEGYDVGDIDTTSIELTTEVVILTNGIEEFTAKIALGAPTAIGDYDEDGIPDLMVKFDRAALVDHLGEADLDEDGESKFYEVPLTVTGALLDGTPFAGTDSIKVIKK